MDQIEKEINKISTAYRWHNTIHWKSTEDATKTLLEVFNEFSKRMIARYNTNIQKSATFYTVAVQYQEIEEIKKTNLISQAQKRIKHPHIKLRR